MRLEDKTVRVLTSAGKEREEYYDDRLENFVLRVTKAGTKTFYVCPRLRGRKLKLWIGKYPVITLAEAREKARSYLLQVSNGIDPTFELKRVRKESTFDQLLALYADDRKTKKETWKEDFRILNKNVSPFVGTWHPLQIPKSEIEEILKKVTARGSPVEANHVLKAIKYLYNWAVKKDKIDQNPFRLMEPPNAEQKRERVLSPSEIKMCWEALAFEEPTFAAVIKLYLTTAQRGGVIKRMERSELDLPNRVWGIPGPKMKMDKMHRAPLNELSLEVLKPFLENGNDNWIFKSDRVLGQPISSIQKSIERVREQCGFHFTAHDLRRTVATQLGQMKVPRLIIMHVMAHADSSVTSIYDRYSYDHERAVAMNLWNERLKQILSGETDFSSAENRTQGQRLLAF